MSIFDFDTFLDQAPKAPGYEPIGRIYKNAFGVDEVIRLHKNYWDYVDWLVDSQGIEIQEWIIGCDMNRDNKPLSENVMEWLYWDENAIVIAMVTLRRRPTHLSVMKNDHFN